MSTYLKGLKDKRDNLEKELLLVNNEINKMENKLVDNELKDIEFNGKLIFVDTPIFEYNIDKEMIHKDLFIGIISLKEDNIKRIQVSDLLITDDFKIGDWFNSLGEEHKRVAFYLTENGSIYHNDRIVRVAAF
jgi:hypothetical protein